MNYKLYVLIVFFLSPSPCLLAQQRFNDTHLPNKEEALGIVKLKLNSLQNFIIMIGSTESSKTVKNNALTGVIDLFEKGARIEVSSLTTDKITNRPAHEYFEGLSKLSETKGYDYIEIFYDPNVIDDIQSRGPDSYSISGRIFQYFFGYKNDKVRYSDFTIKRVDFSRKKYNGIWMTKISNIDVIETHKTKRR